MGLNEFLSLGKKEHRVTEDIEAHITLLRKALDIFKTSLETRNKVLINEVPELERQGDSVRRQIIAHLYEGAYLPYLRPDLCKFVEIVDQVFDTLADTASFYQDVELPTELDDECSRVALLNLRMSEMLLATFHAMLKGEDLQEKILAIRIYEKKVDDIRHNLYGKARRIPVVDFWSGKLLADFISGLTQISDIIEDASDTLLVLNVSMR